jgi:membrane-associated phospholipid phosphatase
MWLWTVAIIISVLTTKQHYLIDVFGGLALAITVIFILKKMTSAPVPALTRERHMESV